MFLREGPGGVTEVWNSGNEIVPGKNEIFSGNNEITVMKYSQVRFCKNEIFAVNNERGIMKYSLATMK